MTPEQHAEAAQAIRDWHAATVRVRDMMRAIRAVLSPEPESEHNNAVWGAIQSYADALNTAYDLDGWLEWWWIECELGDKPMKAAPAGEPLRKIDTVDDLIAVALAGRADD